MLKREGGGADSGKILKRHWLSGGNRRGRQRSRSSWRGECNAGIAGVVMFAVAFLGLCAIFKTIQSERTPRSSSSTLQEMAVANARLASTTDLDSRTQGQSGETHTHGDCTAVAGVVCVLPLLATIACFLNKRYDTWYFFVHWFRFQIRSCILVDHALRIIA